MHTGFTQAGSADRSPSAVSGQVSIGWRHGPAVLAVVDGLLTPTLLLSRTENRDGPGLDHESNRPELCAIINHS